MKKLLHSLLLLSLVGSAMAVGQEDILSLARGDLEKGKSQVDIEKLMKDIDMDEVQKTAEDLMYDVSSNAAQLLIVDIIAALQNKQQYLKVGASKSQPDPIALEQSKAVDPTIAAMRSDLKKLESGVSDPEQLATPAARTALANAAPYAFSSKLAGIFGLSAGVGVAALGAYGTKMAIAEAQKTGGDMDAFKRAMRRQASGAKDALWPTEDDLKGKEGMAKAKEYLKKPVLYGGVTAAAGAGLGALAFTRAGRRLGAKLNHGLKRGWGWMKNNMGLMVGAGVLGAAGAAAGGYAFHSRYYSPYRTANVWQLLAEKGGKKTALLAAQPLIKEDITTAIATLNKYRDNYNRFVATSHHINIFEDSESSKGFDISTPKKCETIWDTVGKKPLDYDVLLEKDNAKRDGELVQAMQWKDRIILTLYSISDLKTRLEALDKELKKAPADDENDDGSKKKKKEGNTPEQGTSPLPVGQDTA